MGNYLSSYLSPKPKEIFLSEVTIIDANGEYHQTSSLASCGEQVNDAANQLHEIQDLQQEDHSDV